MKTIFAVVLFFGVCGAAFAGDAQDFVVNSGMSQQVCTESQGVVTCR